MINYFFKKDAVTDKVPVQRRAIIIAIGLALTAVVYGFMVYSTNDIFINPPEPSALTLWEKTLVHQFLVNKIDELSPKKPQDGVDKFTLDKVIYQTAHSVLVRYNDGANYYESEFIFDVKPDEEPNDNTVTVRNFTIMREGVEPIKDLVK
jgi:hypothetical protein